MQSLFTGELIVPPPVMMPSREVGAVVEFLGIVREMEDGAPLAGLHYEAYERMALTEFARIDEDLRSAFPIAGALVIHRLGWVPVGEASLFVRVFAKHRGVALGYCAALIDRMKLDVPIWKSASAA